ncbi:hypothetical protein CTAYLR_003426 [Chrysophaeum taylorii]|uniref:Uncharacterized protein n=1 Tax=Chrysophaeum taylorii TaxID=2483200 RepID=A0AAD7XFW7_9STRA|nr:hypothetical protein CTAYLR_003426 [Chrysophaeum taylorii]
MVAVDAGTMRAFEKAYPRPIVTVWRSPISDMLQVTHLSLVDKRFKYDPIFGYGYMFIFNMLLEKYPDKLIDASIAALDLNPQTVRSDEIEVAKWLEGKTEADILAAPNNAGDGRLNQVFADIKANDEYLHTRSANLGFLAMMDIVGCKADGETLDRWSEALGLRKRNIERDAVLLKEIREKMSQALQMIKSLEIREKKRLADQLEKKAKEAQEKAEGAATAETASLDTTEGGADAAVA